MRKKDIILAVVVLIAALGSWIFYQFAVPAEDSAKLRITVDGELYGTWDLSQDQTIEIGDTNCCQIAEGKVTMTESQCPDHLCESQKEIDGRGGTIVCLPNRVVLDIISEEEPEIDAISN